MAEREIHDEDRLPALSTFLAVLAEAVQIDAADATAVPESDLCITRLSVSLPFELNLLDEAGGFALDAAPPTQRTRTTVLPVLHQLTLTILHEDEVADDGRIGIETVES